MNQKTIFTSEIEIRETAKFLGVEIPSFCDLVLKCDTQGFEVTILSGFPEEVWKRLR